MKKEIGSVRWVDSRELWVLQVRHEGKRKAFTSKNPSKVKGPAECRAKAQKWLEEADLDADVRFSEAWARFLDSYRTKCRETSARAMEARGKAHLLPALGRKPLRTIKKRDWQELIDHAYAHEAKSLKTLKGISSTVTTFCKWAASRGLIADSAVPLYFDYPRGAGTKQKSILQPDQMRLLFSPEAETSFYIYAFRFLVLTGLRRGELCALQTARDFDGEKITVRESLSHEGIITEGKTKQAQREILLSHLAIDQVRMHKLQQERPGAYLFGTATGSRTSARVLRNAWQKWREVHGIDLTLHELRHTFISYSRLRTSASLEELKEIYGHSADMDTDRTYVHDILLTPEELREKERQAQQLRDQIAGVFEVVIS